MWVVGYEGARNGALMTYGAAAIEMDSGRIMNAVSAGGDGIDRVKFDTYVEKGSVELLVHPIPLVGGIFPRGAMVFDLPTRLWEREPYAMGSSRKHLYLVAWQTQGERSYLVFRNHEALTQWLTGMHFQGFVMVEDTGV